MKINLHETCVCVFVVGYVLHSTDIYVYIYILYIYTIYIYDMYLGLRGVLGCKVE